MLEMKVCRTFSSRFPPPESNPVDPLLGLGLSMAAERRLDLPFGYTMRTLFNREGYTIYGYPSSGSIFIMKTPHILDMSFLSLDRIHATQRSADPVEEDEFCTIS